MRGDLVVTLGKCDRRMHDCDTGRASSLDQRRGVCQESGRFHNGATASCRTPPSVVKSFWYSMSTTAVVAGSNSSFSVMSTPFGCVFRVVVVPVTNHFY